MYFVHLIRFLDFNKGELKMKDDCIFCKLANGVFATNTAYEDDYFRAIMDLSPAAKGHVIILPKEHAANLFELSDDCASKALIVARKVAKAVMEVTGCDGVNILQNNGEAAGQTVFHFHIHVIPRFKDDNLSITWKQNEMDEETLKKLAKEISEKIA